jgi:hypothetical protein
MGKALRERITTIRVGPSKVNALLFDSLPSADESVDEIIDFLTGTDPYLSELVVSHSDILEMPEVTLALAFLSKGLPKGSKLWFDGTISWIRNVLCAAIPKDQGARLVPGATLYGGSLDEQPHSDVVVAFIQPFSSTQGGAHAKR